jgi:GNAT superfamily N-acetyltransferase
MPNPPKVKPKRKTTKPRLAAVEQAVNRENKGAARTAHRHTSYPESYPGSVLYNRQKRKYASNGQAHSGYMHKFAQDSTDFEDNPEEEEWYIAEKQRYMDDIGGDKYRADAERMQKLKQRWWRKTDADGPVAFMGYHVDRGEKAPARNNLTGAFPYQTPGRIWVDYLFVDPEHRRKSGIGSKAIKDLQRYAHYKTNRGQHTTMGLSPLQEAIPFYQKHGFVSNGPGYGFMRWDPKFELDTDVNIDKVDKPAEKPAKKKAKK